MTQLHTIASLDYGDGRTCICRICECGKHHCPGVKVPFVGETTYRDEYVPKAAERERGRRPRGGVFPTKADPSHYLTTKQQAAAALDGVQVRPAESYKPRNELKESLPFEGTTTNRADFPGHIAEYQRVRPAQEPLPKLPGLYNTTKGAMDEPVDDLMQRGALPKPPKGFHSDNSARPTGPFDGITSYTADYPAKEVPQSRFVPRSTLSEPMPDTRDFETTHNGDYKRPPPTLRHDCPAGFVPPRPASTDGHIKLSVYNIPSGDTVV